MLERLDEICAEALAEHGCPSVSVAVAQRGEVVLAEAYGLAGLAEGRAATPATAYLLGSVTKPVTATAVCLAADEGLLDLDAPVPGEYGRRAAPTARQLLQHRGGLGAFYAWEYGEGEPMVDPGRYTVLHREPGTGFTYANLGYRVLGGLLESVTGQPLGAFVRERVFEPLGLHGSHLGRTYPGPAPSAVRYTVDGRAYPDYGCGHPGATLGWAPAGELALFAQSYERLLRPETAAAVRAAPPLNARVGYGLGWSVSYGGTPVVLSHSGGGGGVAAMVVAVPELGLSVAVLSNSTSKAARDMVLRYVLGALVPGYTSALTDPGVPDPARPMDLPEGAVWEGRISAPEREVPVELWVLAGRRIGLRVDGVSVTGEASASEAWAVRAEVPLQLPTADARINSPVLGLQLRLEEGRLTGVAHACKNGDGEGWLGNFLSHPCVLRPG
ncbi:beta-lactamase family protein [Streptomyces sp. N2-109]|uniref:Beta-lactamase family protein n=1 Tax=Streptomyces gossypii TaxID=2883101 RepID=A0ABT2JM31_9ACTN|nr:serine hydrolase domain-containing protein [Streptomyces gossypii]MCT2588935.1 beta-lactamase family protein [Streptomyces gossypii]